VRNGEAAEAVGALEGYLERGAEGDEKVAKARAFLWLGRARQQRDEHEAAEEAFVEVTRLSEGGLAAEAQFGIGATRRRDDDLRGAADAFVKLSILYAHDEWVRRGLLEAARCYEALGEPQKARKFYEELVERFADSTEAREALTRLKGN
jgi:TolA-binding protein